MLVKTAFMLRPPEVAPWGVGWLNNRHQTDIATYRLNRRRGQFGENKSIESLPINYQSDKFVQRKGKKLRFHMPIINKKCICMLCFFLA